MFSTLSSTPSAPVSPPSARTSNPALPEPASAPFDTLIQHALARNPAHAESKLEQHSGNKGLSRQKIGLRSSATNSVRSSERSVSKTKTHDSAEGLQKADSDSDETGKDSPQTAADTAPAQVPDASPLQSLSVVPPVLLPVPPLAQSGALAPGSDPSPNAQALAGEQHTSAQPIVSTQNLDPNQAAKNASQAIKPAIASAPAKDTGQGTPAPAQHDPSLSVTLESLAAGQTKMEALAPEPPKPADASADLNATVPGKAQPPDAPLGTPGAQQETSMKKSEKTPKIADLAQQNLPGAALDTTKESKPSTDSLPASEQVFSASSGENTVSTAGSSNLASVPPSSTASEGTRLGAAERTHDLVALHALRLSESGSDTMRVLIEPGAGLQLSLELRVRDDAIEVQALLHQGDFDHLNRHWSELQHRLEARGVHLGTLTCQEQPASNNQTFQQFKRQLSDQADAGASTDLAFGGSMTKSAPGSRTRFNTHPGWEGWA